MTKKATQQVTTYGLRDTLKVIMEKELGNLPTILEGLEPNERINAICKLMPYVFPKIETVEPTEGERFSW